MRTAPLGGPLGAIAPPPLSLCTAEFPLRVVRLVKGAQFPPTPGFPGRGELGLQGNPDGCDAPSALCVFVPGRGGHRMENGVSVVPVGALGP